MNTSGIRGSLTKSYPQSSQSKQAKTTEASSLLKQPDTKDSILELGAQKHKTITKITTSELIQLNNINGLLGKTKSDLSTLDKEIHNTLKHKNNFSKLEKIVIKTTASTYNDEPIFNQQIRLISDGKENISINTYIKKPPIENMDDVYRLQTQTRKILEDINKIELKINSKVDKKIESMDYVDAKNKKELEYKKLEKETHNKEAFKDLSDTEFIQKELLWLLR